MPKLLELRKTKTSAILSSVTRIGMAMIKRKEWGLKTTMNVSAS